MADSPPPRVRLPGLDALRGLAALAVVAFHYTTRFGIVFGHPSRPWFSVPWGLHGVEVFFVISGFAIELSLESTKKARDFLVSRALRLYPTFWAAGAVTFAVVSVFGLPERVASPRDALLNLSMIPASLGAQAVDAVYWTLERELRFYGLALLLLALGLRRYSVHALLIAVAVQTVDAASHVVPHWISDLLNAHWAHLFASGALLARLRRGMSYKTLGLLGMCVLSSRAIGAVPFFYCVGAVGLVWIATHPFVGARLRPLVFLGKISYPLYLAHQYIGYVVMRALYARGASSNVAILSACAVALAIAIGLHVLIEKPCLERQRLLTIRAPQFRAFAATPTTRKTETPLLRCAAPAPIRRASSLRLRRLSTGPTRRFDE
jgi:peptidoglycan/LPS O-acetylase OafA/YrhL